LMIRRPPRSTLSPYTTLFRSKPRARLTTHVSRFTLHRSLHHRLQDDVAILDAGVVALEVNRPGPRHIGPERAAGATQHRLIVDDLLAIENHRDVAVNEGDVQRLPFPGGRLGALGGFDAAVDGAHVMGVERLAVRVSHLDLVNAA